jgi:hypothetical protein
LIGYYSGSALYGLADGEKPVHAYLVYDSTNNGWDLINGQVGSATDLSQGDRFFNETNIVFGGVLGDVSKLPAYIANNGGQPAISPEMTGVIPEPATITLLAIGGLLLRKRFSK